MTDADVVRPERGSATGDRPGTAPVVLVVQPGIRLGCTVSFPVGILCGSSHPEIPWWIRRSIESPARALRMQLGPWQRNDPWPRFTQWRPTGIRNVAGIAAI